MNCVRQCTDRFPRFSQLEIDECVREIEQSPTLRARVCMHPNTEDRMQEMFIAFSGKTYVRPSFHTKDESFHMLEGRGKYLFFDESGNVTRDVRLGTYNSELPFYCRIPTHQVHSLVLHSKHAMAHEVIAGPFERSNTLFPEWAIDYQHEEERAQFRKRFIDMPVSAIPNCQYERITEEMCRAKPGIVTLRKADLNYLKSEVYSVPRKRIRLCIHPGDDAALHEMFVVYTGLTYVRPNLHRGKDESLHILEGDADFIFFDEDGNVLDVVPLGTQHSGKNFFVRVPQGVFHTIIMRSDYLVIHEATPGPFRKEETLWAPWAPLDSNPEEASQYLQRLESQICEFRGKCL